MIGEWVQLAYFYPLPGVWLSELAGTKVDPLVLGRGALWVDPWWSTEWVLPLGKLFWIFWLASLIPFEYSLGCVMVWSWLGGRSGPSDCGVYSDTFCFCVHSGICRVTVGVSITLASLVVHSRHLLWASFVTFWTLIHFKTFNGIFEQCNAIIEFTVSFLFVSSVLCPCYCHLPRTVGGGSSEKADVHTGYKMSV